MSKKTFFNGLHHLLHGSLCCLDSRKIKYAMHMGLNRKLLGSLLPNSLSLGKPFGKFPTKVSFFLWTAALGRILTTDNLRRRVVVVDWCCMCRRDGETIDHSLMHYPIARELWNMMFSLSRVQWLMPSGFKELLDTW